MMKSFSIAGAFLAVLAAWAGVFPADPRFAQGRAEPLRCQQLYQSYTRCYETGKSAAYNTCVAAAQQTSEALVGRSGQSPPQELVVRALESACLLGCETAKADKFLAYADFERAMSP
jgi:hypothetical protein